MSKYTIVEVVEGECFPFVGIHDTMQEAVDSAKEYYESWMEDDPDLSWLDKWWRSTDISESQHIYLFMSDEGREIHIVEH